MMIKLMYNEEQKQEYIEHESVNEKGVTNYFKRLYPFEEELQKDFASMNRDEIIYTLSSLVGAEKETSRGHCLSLMKNYVRWAAQMGKIDNADDIEDVAPENLLSIEALKRSLFASPDYVREILGKAFIEGYFEKHNKANRIKLVVWLLYQGLTPIEIVNLKKKDLDLRDNTISVFGENDSHMVNVTYDEISVLWESVAEENTLERGGAAAHAPYQLENSDYLIRPVIKAGKSFKGKVEPYIVNGFISDLCKKYKENTEEDIDITPYNIVYSGMYYHLHMLERSGVVITPLAMMDYLGIERTQKNRESSAVNGYSKDYENWKLAFGY